jgi:hypothetical protein
MRTSDAIALALRSMHLSLPQKHLRQSWYLFEGKLSEEEKRRSRNRRYSRTLKLLGRRKSQSGRIHQT